MFKKKKFNTTNYLDGDVDATIKHIREVIHKNIAKPLKDLYCPMYNKVQYFGYDDLNIIHQGDPQFFANHNHFKMSLKNIINYNNHCDPVILNNIINL